jgi:hypothetical protein
MFLDGRYWTIEPTQPGPGRNSITGTIQLVTDALADFRMKDGHRYAFTPAPPDYEPPVCY